MAEMALGYGSEYQLLRYLGHHRMYLDSQIKKATGSNSPIIWQDYPNDPQRDSKDGEWNGIDFLQYREDFGRIKAEWAKFWPTSGRAQAWDGIFEQNGILYLVEAKAHKKEMESECRAVPNSKEKIKEAFRKATGNKEQAELWIDSHHYQLANRLAFLHFCNDIVNIKARLCYIMFLNGYMFNEKKNVTSIKSFQEAWDDECSALGLTHEQRQKINTVYIDCTKC